MGNTPRSPVVVALAALVSATLAARVHAAPGGSCTPEWLPTFGGLPGAEGNVFALAEVDLGSGPLLCAGGAFTNVAGVPASNVALWDGTSWTALGEGLDGEVRALAAYDDGTGIALYAGGSFTTAGGVPAEGIARWDGTSWSGLGAGVAGSVHALAVWDDGGGPALYVGGGFLSVDGINANNIARWDGASWSKLGRGVQVASGEAVYALADYDDGSGPALYVGGPLTTAGAFTMNHLARWNGSGWSSVGVGADSFVWSLETWDDGNGPALYVAGQFASAGGVASAGIARYDGAWSGLGTGTDHAVYTLEVHDDGSGSALYLGGRFTLAGGVSASRIARWDGAGFAPLGAGTGPAPGSVLAHVWALTVFDAGQGAELHAGGQFGKAGDKNAMRLARWDGTTWRTHAGNLGGTVRAMAGFDDGSGPALAVGGDFVSVGNVVGERIARWDHGAWSSLGAGFDGSVRALLEFGTGGARRLYAGGTFTSADGSPAGAIACWDGTTWTEVGGGLTSSLPFTPASVGAFAVWDDGSGQALYVGGDFTAAGGLSVTDLVRWDGSTWSAFGNIQHTVSADVRAFAVFDDGGGEALFVGGQFNSAGGVPATDVARWNGATFLGGYDFVAGGAGGVDALAVFDDGNGARLYASTRSAAVPQPVRMWNGASWVNVGSLPGGGVSALAVFDDGTGPALYAGGSMATVSHVARWDGTTWVTLGPAGIQGSLPQTAISVRTLTVLDVGDGPFLHVGGTFTNAPDSGDGFLARWGCAAKDTTFCFGEVGTCPCGNAGMSGAGCDNAQGTGGVSLALLAQTTSPNGATLVGTGFSTMGAPTALVIRSNALDPAAPVVFGDGLRCVNASPLVRLAATTAVGGSSTHAFGHGAMAGAGDFYYQLWYRNLPTAYCTPDGFNLSSGMRVTW